MALPVAGEEVGADELLIASGEVAAEDLLGGIYKLSVSLAVPENTRTRGGGGAHDSVDDAGDARPASTSCRSQQSRR